MNCHLLYQQIIDRALGQVREKGSGTYFESHHIVPRALGGSDSPDNLVLLTAKEHYVCHHLLHRIHGGPMTYAFWLMCNKLPGRSGMSIPARGYQEARQSIREVRRAAWIADNPNARRDVRGSNNPMYGTSRTGASNPFFGRTHTLAVKTHLSKIAAQRTGHKNPKFRGWIRTPLGVFETLTTAAAAHECDPTTIWRRCRLDSFPEYFLIKEQVNGASTATVTE